MPNLPLEALESTLTASELLDRWEGHIAQRTIARGKLKGLQEAALKKARGVLMGAMQSADRSRIEIERRLGVLQSPERVNSTSFRWLSRLIAKSGCATCSAKAYFGQRLDFWTRDSTKPTPLLRAMCWAGASVAKLEIAQRMCWPLCSQCAKARGGLVNRYGKVDMEKYK